ncbi:peptidoglycan-binding domain-containing protein [Sphingomonas sanguinis]|uniref:peptidoglycan-binding domain-containing protein n=1 Tax=Sphingomonas sanguinis TaxID=33051 RepID=UPI00399BEC54
MILKQGVRGEEVKKLQQILRQFQSVLQIDGVFGPRTERAVRIAQRRLGLVSSRRHCRTSDMGGAQWAVTSAVKAFGYAVPIGQPGTKR